MAAQVYRQIEEASTREGSSEGLRIERSKAGLGSFIQDRHYSEAIQSVKRGKKNDLVCKLNLVIDGNGILRCKGRYENVDMAESVKCPKLLHKD